MRVLSDELHKYIGTQVTIQGWVHRIRSLGGVTFIIVRDRKGMIQVVTDTTDIIPETVVSIEGMVVENDKAPQKVELHNPTIHIYSSPTTELPVSINTPPDMNVDTLLNNRLLTLRIPKMRYIFEVQSCILQGFTEYLRSQDFTEIKTSKIINSGTEGGTGLFELDYFDLKMYLAQSPQLYKQAGVSSGLERVFEVGPVYRAEKHETNRHLNEYTSLDIEMGFVDNVDDLIDLEINLMVYVTTLLQNSCKKQFEAWDAHIPDPERFTQVPRISYEYAKEIVLKESGKRALEVDAHAEKVLGTWAEKECGLNAVFITDFPRRKRPFYTMPDESGQKTKSFDFIFGGVEITSGGLRQHEYNALLDSVSKFNMSPESLEDYLSIFKFGCAPHGGFAIGLERLTQKFLNLSNVKLASMFPRDRNRITP